MINTKLDTNGKESNKFKVGSIVKTNELYQKHLNVKTATAKVNDFSYERTRDGEIIGYIYNFGSDFFLHEDYLKA